MNLIQAIEQAGDNWFRQIGHSQYGFSFSKTGLLKLHESIGGRILTRDYQFDCKEDLTGKWEIVTPEQVMAERK